MSRTIAIGDIHGCDRAFDAILKAISPRPDDTIIALGDYIDRGSGSKQVIDRLIRLQKECNLVALRGNHEEFLLHARDGNQQRIWSWQMNGGVRTLESYGVERALDIPRSHLDFVASTKDFHLFDRFCFMHAFADPSVPFAKQDWDRMRWEHLPSNPKKHMSGLTLVVGHTPQKSGEILDLGHLICIDTLCFGGGWLTALDMQSMAKWQADRFGLMRT